MRRGDPDNDHQSRDRRKYQDHREDVLDDPVPACYPLRLLRRREMKTSQPPMAMTAHPAAASVPLFPGPLPPPVAGAPAGALVVAPGLADVVVPAGVLAVVAVPVGVAELARAAGQISVVAVALGGVHFSQWSCCPPSGSHAIGVPFAATPDSFRSALGQNSPAL